MYSNVDQLTIKKRSELEAEIHIVKPDIICLTEVNPKNTIFEIREEHYRIDGYYIIHDNFKQRGACIFIANHLVATPIDLGSDFLESVWCEITNNSGKTLIGCIYRSGSSTVENNEALLKLLSKATNLKYDHLSIVGDFNLKEIDWKNQIVNALETHFASDFYDKLNDLFLTQHVHEPTRFREGQRPNILDLVITNDEKLVENLSINPPIGVSDHVVINFELDIDTYSKTNTSGYAYYRGNYEEMREDIESLDWEKKLLNKNVQESWHIFSSAMSGLVERHVPLRRYTTRKNLWYNREIDKARKEKNQAWNKYFKNRDAQNSDELYQIFSTKRAKLTNLVIQSKQNFENKIIADAKTNPKSIWSYVKSKTKSKAGIQCLKTEDGTMVSDDKDKADLFNEFFASVFTEESFEDFPKISDNTGDTLQDINITLDKVTKLIGSLNESKAAGPDGIHARVLKECKTSVSVALFDIFNKSLAEGTLPTEWKEAHVKPLFKKGSKQKTSNYRPVSLTSICCKMLEKLIRHEVVNFMETKGLLHKDQHGFRTKRSCLTQLLEIMEIWTSWLDRGLAWDTIYLDFSKAFDSVPHQRLLLKIKKLGITGKILHWIENFLLNRRQQVVVGTEKSSWLPVKSGIPQGSVLGPILFVIFINDLPENVKSSLLKIFADDTKLFKTISSIQDRNDLQQDLNALADWSKKWQLPFNETKCKAIHYGKNNPGHQYYMNDVPLGTDTEEKDLGVTFDSGMKFESHIRSIASKGNSRVGIIRKTFCTLNTENFPLLYKSLVRPILEYCTPIWSPFQRKDINELEKVQRRATKLVKGLQHLEYDERLLKLGLPTLIYRRKRADMLEVFKILHGHSNIDKDMFFQLNHREGARGHSLKLFKPRSCSKLKLNRFSHRVVNTWNSLPEEVVSADSINSFKNRLNNFWKDDPGKFDPLFATYY